MRWTLFLGRLLFGGSFLWAATHNVLNASAIAQSLAAHSVPYAELALALSTLLLMLGGSSIVLGFMPRVGLGAIILYLIPSAFLMQAFWPTSISAGGSELAMFVHVALLGAVVSLMALPVPWPLSVDKWLRDGGGFSGMDTLARGWQRLTRVSRGRNWALRRNRASLPARAENLVSSGSLAHPGSDSWFIRHQTYTRPDGSIVMRSVRAYFFSA